MISVVFPSLFDTMDTENTERAPLTNEALEEMSASEFNDRIVSLPIFACRKCLNFLSPPIMLVAGIGNICGSCNLMDDTKLALHNSALEMILQNMAIPCRNFGRGCKEKVDYFNMSSHDSLCGCRNYCCPMKLFEGCAWEGGSSALLDHSLGNHPGFAIAANGNCFRLDVDISTTNDLIKLLYTDNDKFILHIKCDVEELKLQYIMYYVGSIDKASEFAYTVEQTGCVGINSCSLHHGSNNIILHDVEFMKDFDTARALSIDLTLVKQLVNDPVVATLIKITSKNHNQEELDERLLNFFECPVCNHFMKPPIFQCLAGHSLCNRCRPKLGQCPTCRAGFGNTRNYALEALSNGVRFPCIYRDQGCHTILPVAEITKHEAECALRPYNCPFAEANRCTWEGTHSTITTHLKSHHSDKAKFTNYNKMCVGFSFETNFSDLYCMIAHGQIFRVCHKRDMGNQNTYWAVQLVGPRGDGRKYKCEVGLVDSRNENRKLIRIDMCQDMSNHDNMFNQCIMIPSNIVSWFSCNGQITYYCKITKLATTN